MKESSIISSIKRKAASIPGVRVKKLWSNQMNRDIDLLVVANGLACFYEIKVPGEKPTEWQQAKLDQWRAAGADVGWFDDADKCIERIRYMAAIGERVHNACINDTLYQIAKCGCVQIGERTWILCTGHENRLADIVFGVTW